MISRSTRWALAFAAGSRRFYWKGAWRTRNTMLERFHVHSSSKDAHNTLVFLTSLKNDAQRLDSAAKERLPRLLKEDLLSMLHTLLEKNQVEVAIKVLDHVRKEPWYRPERKFFDAIARAFAKSSNFAALAALWEEMEIHHIALREETLIRLVEQCVVAQQQELAFKIFATLNPRASQSSLYWRLIGCLNRAREFDASLKLEEALMDARKTRHRARDEIHSLRPWAS